MIPDTCPSDTTPSLCSSYDMGLLPVSQQSSTQLRSLHVMRRQTGTDLPIWSHIANSLIGIDFKDSDASLDDLNLFCRETRNLLHLLSRQLMINMDLKVDVDYVVQEKLSKSLKLLKVHITDSLLAAEMIRKSTWIGFEGDKSQWLLKKRDSHR